MRYYEELGLRVTKVHSIISFKEENWLKPYIEFNTNQRQSSKTEFEKDMWKLMNNSFYGKTCENIRKRRDIRLVTDFKEAEKLHREPNYMNEVIFQENVLSAIEMNIVQIEYNKPIAVGVAVLDLSKYLMYNMFYGLLLPFCNDNKIYSEIMGYDTDGFFLLLSKNDPEFDIYIKILRMNI